MFVKCIAPFGTQAIGDVTEIPDGSKVSEFWFVPCDSEGVLIPPVADDGSGFAPLA